MASRCDHATGGVTSQGQALYLAVGTCPKCGEDLGDNREELDTQLDMLMNSNGKYYMYAGWPYNAEEPNTRDTLRAARIHFFKKWLYEKGFR